MNDSDVFVLKRALKRAGDEGKTRMRITASALQELGGTLPAAQQQQCDSLEPVENDTDLQKDQKQAMRSKIVCEVECREVDQLVASYKALKKPSEPSE